MIPDGLQYQSIETIVSRVKSLGMNVIRLTYAIEVRCRLLLDRNMLTILLQMIDDIIDNNPNSTLKNSFINALGTTNGTSVVKNILEKNPQFTEETTRIEVFDAVAAECLKQQMYQSAFCRPSQVYSYMMLTRVQLCTSRQPNEQRCLVLQR